MAQVVYPRLDDERDVPAVLTAGNQLINVQKNARLQGLNVNGRTLVNLLGNTGGGESLSGWIQVGSPTTISTTRKRSGNSSFKFMPEATRSSYLYRDIEYNLDKTKYYVVAMWVYIESGGGASSPAEISIREIGTFTVRYGSYTTTRVGEWQLLVVKIPIGNTLVGTGFRVLIGFGASGQAEAYLDEARIYAISEAEYTSIGTTLVGSIIDTHFPYVSSGINGVDGLYIKRYGKNLLPSVPDALHSNARVSGSYEVTLVATRSFQSSYMDFLALQATQYTFSVLNQQPGSYYYALALNENGLAIGSVLFTTQGQSGSLTRTFTTPVGTAIINFVMTNNSDTLGTTGTFIFRNWQLELGSIPTPFTPREDSILNFSGVELHADPTDGSNPDILKEVGGRYYKDSKWKKVVLDGSHSYGYYINHYTGFKRISIDMDISDSWSLVNKNGSNGFLVTKFDGTPLTNDDTALKADRAQFISVFDNKFVISLSNAETGWGHTYVPTSEDIADYLSNKPYQLLYMLNKVSTVSVQEEGSVFLAEGLNHVEVGSGYVSREHITPISSSSLGDAEYQINDTYWDSQFKYKAREIENIYENNLIHSNWRKYTNGTPYGKVRAGIQHEFFDKTASYSASYLKEDRNPVSFISGVFALTEKSQIRDLTEGVSEAMARISVLESKKVNTDSPYWITPTLINDWSNMSENFENVGYYKDSSGIVRLKGYIKVGLLGSPVFVLPVGYRPKLTNIFASASYFEAGRIDILDNGEVTPLIGDMYFTLDGISFLAEK